MPVDNFFFEKMSIQFLCPFCNYIISGFAVEFSEFLVFWNINPLSVCSLQIFSSVCRFPFHFVDYSFCSAEAF